MHAELASAPLQAQRPPPLQVKQLRSPLCAGCISALGKGALGRKIFLRDFYLEKQRLLKGTIKFVLNVPLLPPMPLNSRLQPITTSFFSSISLRTTTKVL